MDNNVSALVDRRRAPGIGQCREPNRVPVRNREDEVGLFQKCWSADRRPLLYRCEWIWNAEELAMCCGLRVMVLFGRFSFALTG